MLWSRCRIALAQFAALNVLRMTVALPSTLTPETSSFQQPNSSLLNPATIDCSPRYLAPSLSDCRETVRLLPTGGKVLDFWDTQQPPKHGEPSPQSWQWPGGECHLGLHFPQDPTTLRDYASWNHIRKQADALLKACVRNLRQGGQIRVGTFGSLQLTVFQESPDWLAANRTVLGVGSGTSGVEAGTGGVDTD